MFGSEVEWDSTEHLLALVADLLAVANWQRAGDKKKRRPKPLPRPGETLRRLNPAEIRERLLAQRARRGRRAS